MRITEHELDAFRSEHLRPAALLALVELWVRVLIRVAVGVGKSVAADGLLLSADTYSRFRFVIYAAPTWDIIYERAVVADPKRSPVPTLVLRPRPSERCGALDKQWRDLEEQHCGTLARATICESCPHRTAATDPCRWPDRFKGIEDIQLVICTDQQFVLNRSLVAFLRDLIGDGRMLVILDEGQLFDARYDVVLEQGVLRVFQDVLRDIRGKRGRYPAWARDTVQAIEFLLDGDLDAGARTIPKFLNRHAFAIQRAGVERFGGKFVYLGYDLADLHWSKQSERWRNTKGGIRFIARPYLHCHLLVLSAHLSGAYVGSRLGEGPIPSPFENHRFIHTQTRAINLRSRLGVDRYYDRNLVQVLDVFAVLLLRNVEQGRSSVVICRKKRRADVANYLRQRLAGWGVSVEFLVDDTRDLPPVPSPQIIPVLHYGVLGINDYAGYEAAYCVDSYYVPTCALNAAVHAAEPEAFHQTLEIYSGNDRFRRVRVARPADPDQGLLAVADLFLARLETDRVIQVVGRVRYATRPREVITFQMTDMGRAIEGCREVASLDQLRAVLGLPKAKDIDFAVQVRRIEELLAQGLTEEQIATELRVSRSTVSRRRAAVKCVKNPTTTLIRVSDTSAASLAAPEGGA